jgi:UPF0755 protein
MMLFKSKNKIKTISLLFICLFVCLCFWGIQKYWLQLFDQPHQLQLTELKIESGKSARLLRKDLMAMGFDVPELAWRVFLKINPQLSQIQSGHYEFESSMSIRHILKKIVDGDVKQYRFTVIEGWTFKQFQSQIAQLPYVKHKTKNWTEQQLMAALGSDILQAEGQFLPETYFYTAGTADLMIFKRAHRMLMQELETVWQLKPEKFPINSPQELLILASIIEKESGHNSEQAKIARVFLNRLAISMRLQADPTVIYGMGQAFDGNIRKKDLKMKTAYNTYQIKGLPPTPIALPGRGALKAVVTPASGAWLYFVAMPNGEHAFSENLSDHNQAVKTYQLMQSL